MWGAAAVAGAGLASNIIGNKKHKKSMQQVRDIENQRLARLDAIPLPVLEEFIAENPEFMQELMQMDPEILGQVDPRLLKAQYDVLNTQSEISQQGLSFRSRADLNQVRSRASADNAAKQSLIQQQAQQRGMGRSGMAMAMQQGAAQDATRRQSEEQDRAMQMAMQGQQAALSKKSNLASSMRSQDFARNKAKAQIGQFNTGLQQQHQQAKQGHEYQRAELANKEKMYNLQRSQQDFENRMAKATGATNMLGDRSRLEQQYGQQRAQGYQRIGSGLINAGMGVAQYNAADGAIISNNNRKKYNDGGFELAELLERVKRQKQAADGSEWITSKGGDVVPGESYAHDLLPARLNSGEMVTNLDQQDGDARAKGIGPIVEGFDPKKGRMDEQVNEGTARINSKNQSKLFDTYKKNATSKRAKRRG